MAHKADNTNILLITTAALLGIFSTSTPADIIYVKQGGTGIGSSWADPNGLLQWAIENANYNDEIWVAAGIYHPTIIDPCDPRSAAFQMKNGVAIYGGFPDTGDPDMTDRNPNMYETILSGDLLGNDNPDTPAEDLYMNPYRTDNCYHVFYHPYGFVLDPNAVLDGFTITGGNADGSLQIPSHKFSGGGMYNRQSSQTVTNCVFSGNYAGRGGGMSNNGYKSNPTVISCTFTSNSAASGGGMKNVGEGAIVTNCIFTGNLALGDGGGMYNVSSNPTVTGCTFSGNSASRFGGGMDNYQYSYPTVTGCTFTNNSADYGGGMYVGWECNPKVTNCIFWGNTASSEFNEIEERALVSYSCVQGGYTGTGNIDADPIFIDHDRVDGIIGTEDDNLRLQVDSPCIDAGDNSAVTEANDLDGQPRVIDGDGNRIATVDMGAYEYCGPVPTVIFANAAATSGGNNGSSWEDAFISLQDALDIAAGIDEIWVATGIYYPTSDYGLGIGDRGRHFRMINGVGIYGGFPNSGYPGWRDRDPNQYETILSGDLLCNDNPDTPVEDLNYDPCRTDNCYHIFYHPDGLSLEPNAILNGFTITGGYSDIIPWIHSIGSGMYNYSSSPTVTDCIFTFNAAVKGGGMYNEGSSPIVENCTFTSSFVGEGGGMYNCDNSNPVVTGCTFSNNFVSSGGGISNYHYSNPIVTSCTFINNSAEWGGGILNRDSSNPTVTNCDLSGNSAIYYGGGMNNDFSNPKVTSCTFTNNSAEYGGGIYNDEGSDLTVINCAFTGNIASWAGGGMCNMLISSPIVNNCTFSGNSAGGDGGGMFNTHYSNPTVTNCTFTGNSCNEAGGGMHNSFSSLEVISCTFGGNSADRGGGMYNEHGEPIVTVCAFTSNSAKGGGGMDNSESSPTVANCTFNANSAIHAGGGMFNYNESDTTLVNCSFSGNSADEGGGMRNTKSNPTVTNCTFSGNRAKAGGGIENVESSPVLLNSTFSDNSAVYVGGGVYNYENSNLTITNCILWGNIASYGANEINNYSSNPEISYCDIAGSFPGGSWDTSLGFDDGDNIDADPCFVHSGYWDQNGTPADPNDDFWVDGDYRLLPTSPCIDIGNNSVVTEPTDLVGRPRIADGDGNGTTIVDMGAYERRLIYVDATADGANNGTTWSDAYNDLQNALDIAAGGDEIWVATGTYKPTKLIDPNDPRTATFQMTNSVAIYGGFPTGGDMFTNRDLNMYKSILSGDLLGNDNPGIPIEDLLDDPSRADNCYHVFYHPDNLALDPNSVLDGFTITAANANGSSLYMSMSGAGIYNYSCSPTVTNCTFTSNSTFSSGGGMWNYNNSSPTVTNCIFSGNLAVGHGGGMENHKYSNTTVTSCTFSGNLAEHDGGGMYNSYNSNPTVTGCTFADNSTSDDGGGMCNANNTSPTVTGCTFGGNSANWRGGGMFNNDDSSPTVTGCVFNDNSVKNGGGMCNYYGSSPTVTDCTFIGNSVNNSGGGMYNYYSNPVVINCTFGGNLADNNGGGMSNFKNNLEVTNCIFNGNSAVIEGGGIFNWNDTSTKVTSCAFVGNLALNGNAIACDSYQQSYPNTLDITNSILWDGGDEVFNNDGSTLTITYSDIQGDWAGKGNIDSDPLFADPGGLDNIIGTEDDNLRLLPGSPCTDAGDNDAVPETITTDIDGLPRFYDDVHTVDTGNGAGAIVDMGAHEFISCDFEPDGDIDGFDLISFILYWLDTDCGRCGGADLTGEGDVDLVDFAVFNSLWLAGVGEIVDIELSVNNSWMYQNLQSSTKSNLNTDISIIYDPLANTNYTYEWEFILPDDIAVEPLTISGGGTSDTSWNFAAPDCYQAGGLSDSGQAITVRVTVTGNDFANTGQAEAQFGIALLGDVNNDGVVNIADSSIVNAFWQTGSAGSFSLRDCDINSDGTVNIADRSIVNAIWRGVLGQNSVSSPCPFR